MSEEKKYTGINKFIKSGAIQTILDKKEEGSFAEFFDDWKWIFSYSFKYKWVIVLYTVLGILSSSLSLVSAYVGRVIINIVVSREVNHIWLLISLMIGSMLVSLIFSSIMSRILTKISIYVNNDIQADIFDKIIDSKWTELTKYSGGDLLNRFWADVGTISNNAVSWIPNLIINLYTFIVTFIILWKLDVIMACIALVAGPILLLISRIILRKMRMYRKNVLELNSKMMHFESEAFYNLDMIKSFGIIDYYSKRLRFWQKKSKETNLDYNKFEIKTNALMTILSSVVSILAMLYCVYLLWTNRILYGDMTFFLQQRELLTGRFHTLASTLPGMVSSAVSAHRIREIVALEKEHHDEKSYEELKQIAHNGISIRMDNVSFAYRENEVVYKDSNFEANPGEIVAILGTSGGGKTTLMRMILGLIESQTGDVSLVDCDGKKVDISIDVRKLFSYVPQGNTVLSGTISENMRMVKEDATDEELISSLKIACAWDFVSKLPEGINNELSDNGRGLSMGQNQRISIARALLKDSPIVLLDEATSALDIETERDVLRNIVKKQPNKTYVISTHRPSVLHQATRVYRIIDNRIKGLSKDEVDEIIRTYTWDDPTEETE